MLSGRAELGQGVLQEQALRLTGLLRQPGQQGKLVPLRAIEGGVGIEGQRG